MKIKLSRRFSEIVSNKTQGWDKPTIWYKFTRLAQMTQSVNLGQGFPDWECPDFLLESLNKHFSSPTANHQYTRSFGSIKLVDSIARKHSLILNRIIDPMKEVLATTGAVSALYNLITAFIEPGDEVVALEPFYDCYLPQTVFSGGKMIGVPMIPPTFRNKQEYTQLGEKIIKDEWKIDFNKLRESLTSRTKLLILNTPHNPTGKILTEDELKEIASILKAFPRVIVLMDEVYEHMIYDNYTSIPRMANIPGMWDRTVSVMSAGKFLSATGLRIGWVIGPSSLVTPAMSIHQINSFCINDPLQSAVADSLDIAELPYKGFKNYYEWLRDRYCQQRNYFIKQLSQLEGFNLNILNPEGGYFVIADISQEQNKFKYKFEGEEKEENKYSKDFNYLLNLAHEKKVVGIPISAFYTEENKNYGENFIRLAFCKKKETLDKALQNLKH